MKALELRIPPPLAAVAVAATMWALARCLPVLALDIGPGSWLALFVASCALALDIVALRAFVRARTSLNPLRPAAASTLVTHGAYRISRNPMYLGLALWLLAFGLWLANAASIMAVTLFVAYIDRFQIRPEERALHARFGAEFERYRNTVRRWL